MNHILEYNEYSDEIYNDFIKAIKKCDTEAVEMMLNNNDVDPGAHDSLALSHAGDNGCVDIIKLLLADDRVDINGKESRAITYAAMNHHKEAVELLMNKDMHLEAYPHVINSAKWNKWINILDYFVVTKIGLNYMKLLRSKTDPDDLYTNALMRHFEVEDNESLDIMLKMASE